MARESEVTVKSLDNAKTLILSNGGEIQFHNGLASVPESIAKEIVERPGSRYVVYSSKMEASGLRSRDASIDNLELEFMELIRIPKNLAPLRGWLHSKLGDIEPALLSHQKEIGASNEIVEEAGRYVPPTGVEQSSDILPSSGSVVAESDMRNVGEDSMDNDPLDDMNVDGEDVSEQSAVERAERLLSS